MDVEKVTKEAVNKGGILAITYFDIHERSKEAVQNLGKGFVKSIIEKPGIVFALGEIAEPQLQENGQMWSTSVSVKVLTRDFMTLTNLCMAHSPFSVEILRPNEVKLDSTSVSEIMLGVGAMTAEYKKYILTKIASNQEKEQFLSDMKMREEMGKNITKDEKAVK